MLGVLLVVVAVSLVAFLLYTIIYTGRSAIDSNSPSEVVADTVAGAAEPGAAPSDAAEPNADADAAPSIVLAVNGPTVVALPEEQPLTAQDLAATVTAQVAGAADDAESLQSTLAEDEAWETAEDSDAAPAPQQQKISAMEQAFAQARQRASLAVPAWKDEDSEISSLVTRVRRGDAAAVHQSVLELRSHLMPVAVAGASEDGAPDATNAGAASRSTMPMTAAEESEWKAAKARRFPAGFHAAATTPEEREMQTKTAKMMRELAEEVPEHRQQLLHAAARLGARHATRAQVEKVRGAAEAHRHAVLEQDIAAVKQQHKATLSSRRRRVMEA